MNFLLASVPQLPSNKIDWIKAINQMAYSPFNYETLQLSLYMIGLSGAIWLQRLALLQITLQVASLLEILGFAMSFVTKIQLHATHATAN
jgi:hypothetical protein